jgi:hypothetical protein
MNCMTKESGFHFRKVQEFLSSPKLAVRLNDLPASNIIGDNSLFPVRARARVCKTAKA